jgi:calcium-translocating P-type ATPase
MEGGLTSEDARERLKNFGPNILSKQRQFSGLKILFSQFTSPLIYILVFAGLVALLLREYTDAIVIFGAVSINTILGFWQERKAEQSLSALRSLLAQKAQVIRDGQQQVIDAQELVPGDLVVLVIGAKIPADGILLEARDFGVNEAVLTGESFPVVKRAARKSLFASLDSLSSDIDWLTKTQSRRGAALLEKENKAFMGTTVVSGLAKMMVTKTGKSTQMGGIGEKVSQAREEKTPLQAQLAKLAKILAIIVGIFAGVIFFAGEHLGYKPLEMFTISVAVAVAAIPEGLAVTLTVILALGMQRILKRKAVVRKLIAAETLGCVSIICADKTGTLTEGEMKVVDGVTDKKEKLAKEILLKGAILCNDMRDPLEVGMLRWAEEQLTEEELRRLRRDYPRLDGQPFSHQSKIIATLHPGLLLVSGAPEVVMSSCRISSTESRAWAKKFENFGSKAYRLVAIAYKKVGKNKKSFKNTDLKNLEWAGILVYEDLVRTSVKKALVECRRAGIQVKVITGDHPATAIAVMEKLGLEVKQNQVMTGLELETVSEDELEIIAKKVLLFARTNPEQKLKIVKVLKENHEVVAMTGDGVNDAPALKQADIGIVVGEATDVAKETADIILLDSDFSTIVAAIEEGRSIFENLKKVVVYLLSDSFTEVILIGGSIVLGLPLPVTAAQILWVNLIEDTLPNLALAFEPEEKELMTNPPRSRNEPLLDAEMKVLIFVIGIMTDFVLLGLYLFLLKGVFHLHFIRTVVFVCLGIDSLFYVFSCRSLRKTVFQKGIFGNPALVGAAAFGFFSLTAAVYFPFLQRLLRTQALGLAEWTLVVGLGIFNVLAIEAAKWFFISKASRVDR